MPPDSTTPREMKPGVRWQLAFGLAALVLVAFWRVVAGGVFFYCDFHQTFEPLRAILGESIRSQSLLWSHRIGNGYPVLANPINASLYPPNWLFGIASTPRLLTILAVLHLYWTGLGTGLLLLAWKAPRAAASTGAIVAAFSGLVVSTAAPVGFAWTLAWTPWFLLAADRLARSESRPTLLGILGLGGTTAALLSTGEPFVILSSMGGAVLLWLARERVSSFTTNSFIQRLPWPIAAGLAIGGALALPAWIASFRYFPASIRGSGFLPEGVLQWSLHPVEALGLVISDPFGDPSLYGNGGFWGKALVPEHRHSLFGGLYVGALTLGLVLAGIVTRGRRIVALFVWLLALVLLALGRFGPIYPTLVAWGLDSLRYPIKWLVPAMIPIALLAGLGVASMSEGSMPARRRTMSVLAVAGVGFLGLLGLLWANAERIVALASDAAPADARAHLLAGLTRGFLPLLAVILAGALLVRRRPEVWPYLTALLVTIDLVPNTLHYAPVTLPEFYESVPVAVRIVTKDPRGVGRVWIEEKSEESLRWRKRPETAEEYFRWERESLRQLTGASYGLTLAFSADMEAFAPLRYSQLSVLVGDAPERERAMTLGAAGVTHVVGFDAPLRTDFFETLAILPGRTDPPLRISRNRLALPRVRFVERAIPIDGLAGLLRCVRESPDDLFAKGVLVEESELARLDVPPPAASTANRQAKIAEDRGHLIRIRTAGEAGWLALSDVIVPGWRAELDGQPAAMVPGDWAFRALPVPSGEHEVVFRYDPW